VSELRDEREDGHAVLRSERVFAGRVWDVVSEEVDLDGSPVVRDFIRHTGAVAVLALDDDERVLLIRQYRHPIRRRDWEIPAGLLDRDGESPIDAARRELAEEADLLAERWDHLIDFYSSPGGSSEAVRIYLARGISAAEEEFARVDEEARIERRWVPLDELVQAALHRGIGNPSLLIGSFAAHAARDAGWATLGPVDAPWPAPREER